MGNEVSSKQLKSIAKDSINEKVTASSQANHVFQDFQDLEPQSHEDDKFTKFLGNNFKSNKIASKQVQFKIINKNCQNNKNLIIRHQQSNCDLEKSSQSPNENQNSYNEIKNVLKTVSEKNDLLGIDTISTSSIFKTDGNAEKYDLMANRDPFDSLGSKYKQLCINQQKFVKLKRHDFQNYYEIVEKIGEGTTGNVFSVRCKKTGQIRAVKILKSKVLTAPSLRKFFHSELEVAINFDHPNVVKIYDIFHYNGTYYIVTECCTGGTLQKFASKSVDVDYKLLKVIFKQIFSALNYLHSQSIIHRDVKLQNIVFVTDPFLCKSLDDIQVKIIDFGLSKKVKFKAVNKDIPCLGTPLYMAPEVMKGQYSQKCDIWACGIIMHFLLFKEFPFESSQIEEIYKKITSQQIDFSKSYWTKIPNDLRFLLQGILHKSPARRINAQKALNSQWLQQLKLDEPKKKQKEFIYNRLASYKKENNFISLIESFSIFSKQKSQLNPQDLKLIRLFQKIDSNNNGFIEINELEQILEDSIRYEGNKRSQIREMIQKVDKNNSGKIQFSEFLSLFMDRKELFSDECLNRAFDFFDSGKSGYISRRELMKILQGCDDAEFQDVWKDLDVNSDGLVSKQQFIRYFRLLQSGSFSPKNRQKSLLLVELEQ